MSKKGNNVLARNNRARHDYFIEETYEAGIVLKGTEIKSIRAGRMQLKDSFARVSNGEIFLHNAHISEYEQGNRYNHDPTRARKLLMHKRQINELQGKSQRKGYSLIPLQVYLKRGFAKVLIGLARGKKEYDKRETLRRQDAKREIERALREREKQL